VNWRYLPIALPWLARFLRHSSRDEVTRIATALRALMQPIFESYDPILERAQAGDLVRRTGCLYVYSSRAVAQQWKWGMELRRSLGVQMRDVEEDELVRLEPDLRGRFRFGVLAPENGSTLDPSRLVKTIHAQCERDGAESVRAEVVGFSRSSSSRSARVTGVTLSDGRTLPCDGAVIAGGAWSGRLTSTLGLRVPLETQRGYHVTVHSPNLSLRHTVMAVEHNLMVNSMSMGLRLAGSVEFAGLAAPPNYQRARVLLAKGREMFPHLDTRSTSEWMGHRPCLPDSLPVIGAAPGPENVWLAFGHGHVGMCCAATTGREIAHLVSGRVPQVDLTPFSPSRF
jgi:D-amino-acid dehydrogenase